MITQIGAFSLNLGTSNEQINIPWKDFFKRNKIIKKKIFRNFLEKHYVLTLLVPKTQQQMHLKLLQKQKIQKTAEATGDFIANKIADKITGAASQNAPANQ